jgi:CMP/dCMP kinase
VNAPVLTVDGPGGAGKGTVCAMLAAELGWHLLDSGAIYRLLGLKARRADIELADVDAVCALACQLDIKFTAGGGAGELVRTWLDGVDVSAEIRTEAAGADASIVASNGAARDALLDRQRRLRSPPGLVADGRDMGTVVFPDAELKIFLSASAEERTQRRYKQLIEKGVDASLADLSAEIAERDRRDRERAVAPLKPASGAVSIDTTGVPIDIVVERVRSLLRDRGLS